MMKGTSKLRRLRSHLLVREALDRIHLLFLFRAVDPNRIARAYDLRRFMKFRPIQKQHSQLLHVEVVEYFTSRGILVV